MVRNVVKTTKSVKTPTGSATVPTAGPGQPKNNYGISKVERLSRPASDNNTRRVGYRIGSQRPNNERRLLNAKSAPIKEITGRAVNVARAASVAWVIVGATSLFYSIQFVIALLYLITIGGLMAYEGSWLRTLDLPGWGGKAGAGAFTLFMGVLLAMWICTFVTAFFLFFFRDVSIGRGHSLIIALMSLVFMLVPVVNLVPWVWVWCAYVVKTQADQ